MADQKFEVGQKVIAAKSFSWLLTEGKTYEVIDYAPAWYMGSGFTWPAYVTVIGDSGKPVSGHAHRFRPA